MSLELEAAQDRERALDELIAWVQSYPRRRPDLLGGVSGSGADPVGAGTGVGLLGEGMKYMLDEILACQSAGALKLSPDDLGAVRMLHRAGGIAVGVDAVLWTKRLYDSKGVFKLYWYGGAGGR